MKAKVLVALMVIAIIAASAAAFLWRPSSPTQVTVQFIEVYLQFGGELIWKESSRLKRLVTREFYQSVIDAQKGEECFQGNEPGPPYIGGDVFTSLFEGATSGRIVEVSEKSGSALAVVEWTHTASEEYGDGSSTSWRDGIELRMEGGEWKISDFLHNGDWEFMYKASALNILKSAGELCRQESSNGG